MYNYINKYIYIYTSNRFAVIYRWWYDMIWYGLIAERQISSNAFFGLIFLSSPLAWFFLIYFLFGFRIWFSFSLFSLFWFAWVSCVFRYKNWCAKNSIAKTTHQHRNAHTSIHTFMFMHENFYWLPFYGIL